MFRFTLRKMFKNRWLALSLLIGYIMAVAIVGSMPVYSHAVLNRMLQKDLQKVQTDKNVYPGQVQTEITPSRGTSAPSAKTEEFHRYDSMLRDEIMPSMGLDVQMESTYKAVKNLHVTHKGVEQERVKKDAEDATLASCDGLFDHVTLLEGSFPSGEVKDGVYEAVISEEAAMSTGCSYGSVYDLYEYDFVGASSVPRKVAKVKITGVFTPADPADVFWMIPLDTFSQSILIDPGLFSSDFMETEEPLFNFAFWSYALDYTQMTPENCGDVSEKVAHYSDTKVFPPKLRTPFASILENYELRRQHLEETLWVIEIPILLMLLFYVLMVSRLILGHERNEIAVLESRGSSKAQITGVYLYQAVFLSAAALITGPLISLLFCRMIGAANGFMEFVNRRALNVSLTPNALIYAFITAGALVLTMLAAVIFSWEGSIVSFKRKKSGKKAVSLWEKLCLDLVCLAVALYGLYNFQNRLQVMRETGANAADVPIDFMMYGSSTLFILGATLLFLRFFPLLIRLVFRVGRQLWGPVVYLSLINISRSGGRNQMISLFLIFTLSMGVFNAVTVRTLNQNEEDRIRYTIGADVALQEEWPSTGGPTGTVMGAPGQGGEDEPVYYTEPRFSKYEEMETVERAARVLTVKNVSLSSNSKNIKNITLMGVVPDEFGETCWFRPGLLPHHINEYLNLMAEEPRALLLSNKAMEKNELKPGDTVYLSVGDNKDTVQCVVYAGIDYFPSFNPVYDGKNEKLEPVLAVANLIYLQQETKLQPYSVWLKKAPGVTSSQLYDEIAAMGSNILSLDDAAVQVTELKNDAMTQGVNGYFTLSFLITMLITLVGFFIYWILTIKGRLLQFGILRSMGLSRMSVIFVLLWEQILVSVTAILAGLGIGSLAAVLYAPILECNVDASEQILPFMVAASGKDYGIIILFVAGMLLLAGAVLGRIVYKLRASEALKLGED